MKLNEQYDSMIEELEQARQLLLEWVLKATHVMDERTEMKELRQRTSTFLTKGEVK